MAQPLSAAAATDPTRQHLREVRIALLRLHKALIDAERVAFERRNGPMTSGAFLQALLGDPFFAWLRPFSTLIVQMDEVLATREPVSEAQAQEFRGQVLALIAAPEGASAERRYEVVQHSDPGALAAHLELVRRLAAFT